MKSIKSLAKLADMKRTKGKYTLYLSHANIKMIKSKIKKSPLSVSFVVDEAITSYVKKAIPK